MACEELSWVCRETGRCREAESLACEALRMRRKVLGPDDPMVARSMIDVAGYRRNCFAVSESLYVRAVAILEKSGREWSGDLRRGYRDLAALYRRHGDHGQAEAVAERAELLPGEELF